MPRNRNLPERVGRGRFVSDDDYDRRRGDGDRGGDRGQGGWFGDPPGHSEASERGWDRRRGADDDNRHHRGRHQAERGRLRPPFRFRHAGRPRRRRFR